MRRTSSNKFLLSFYFRHPSLVTPFDAMISASAKLRQQQCVAFKGKKTCLSLPLQHLTMLKGSRGKGGDLAPCSLGIPEPGEGRNNFYFVTYKLLTSVLSFWDSYMGKASQCSCWCTHSASCGSSWHVTHVCLCFFFFYEFWCKLTSVLLEGPWVAVVPVFCFLGEW